MLHERATCDNIEVMHWAKTATGYTMSGNTLNRVGRVWTLTTAAGVVHLLGKRASFDEAEALL